jgi:four helix bundle protein
MNADEMKKRTKRFALDIIFLVENLPKTRITEVVGRQLLRSGTSLGANYRAACSARSISEFIAKMGIVEEELDESLYWMELLIESGCLSPDQAKDVIREA